MTTMTTPPGCAETAPTPAPTDPKARGAGTRWARRAGTGVFLFFLIKGLLWLLVPPLLILGARLFAQ